MPPPTRSYRYCFVPGCRSTSIKYPDKWWFLVPFKEKERNEWIKAAGRDSIVSPKSKLYCCEDHFDVEEDMENYMCYKSYLSMGFSTQARLKPGVVPHKFDCPNVLLTPKLEVEEAHEQLQLPTFLGDLFGMLSERDEEGSEPREDPSSPLHIKDEGTDEASDLSGDNSLFCCSNAGSSQSPEQKIIAEPLPESVSIKKEDELDCDESNQIIVTAWTLDEPLKDFSRKRVLLDSTTQIEPPQKHARQTTPEPSSSCGTTTISVRKDLYGVSSSSATTSHTLVIDENHKSSLIKKNIRVANLYNIEKDPMFYIGIPQGSYRFLEKLATVAQCSLRGVLITLKKLRFNQPFKALADDFGITVDTVTKLFSSVIFTLGAELRSLIYWPPKDFISRNMPIPFRKRYSKVVGIIDCFEVKLEKPKKPLDQALTWSQYEKANTIKFMVSSTPHGYITFISEGYGGRITDTDLTNKCGFINTIPNQRRLLAGRGFKLLDKSLKRRFKLMRPPSVRSGEKLSMECAREAKTIASLQMDIERVIGRIREFQFLAPETVLDLKMAEMLNVAVIVVCALCNLGDPF